MKYNKDKISNNKKVSIEKYRESKIKILRRDFKITLTDEEAKHVNSLQSEIKIDQFCLGVMNKRWG